MNLILIRHTSVSARNGLCYGWTDVPPSENFSSEAEAVRRQLPPGPWRVVSSPLLRCLRLANTFGAPVETDERLKELHFGQWEQRLWSKIPREESDPWMSNFVKEAPPGGESFMELARRAEAFVADCARRNPDEIVLVVTHAGVIRALLAPRRGLPLSDAFSITVEFGGLYPIDPNPIAASL